MTRKSPHGLKKQKELLQMLERGPEARLPHVDGEALIQEDDPEVLGAYARGLWQQWQALSGEGGTPAKRYPKETIKSAVVWLTDAYVDVEEPIPYELARVIRALIRPKQSASTSPVHSGSEEAYLAAIMFEAATPDAMPSAIARHLIERGLLVRDAGKRQGMQPSPKGAEATVRGWQKEPDYQSNVRLYRRKPEVE